MRAFVRIWLFPLALTPVLVGQVRLTLAEAISQALRENPRLAAASDRIGVAEGLRKQAGLPPNPRLIVQLENTRFWGNPAVLVPARHG